MSKNEKNSEEKFIQMLVKLFYKADQNKFRKDIEQVKKMENKSKFLNTFLKKYSNSQMDSQTCQQMLHDIISKLINLRKDFVPFMKIYMITDDKIKAETLRNYSILKKEKLRKVENGDTDNLPYFEFEVNLSCVYDIESYYQTFIKGILNYFQMAFKENYLYEYIEIDYFRNLKESKLYKENISSLENSINKMLIDIDRVIFELSYKDENKNEENNEHKMTKSKFEILQFKAGLHTNKEIGNIFNRCKNDDEILKTVDKLLEINKEGELHLPLLAFRDDIEVYIKKEKEEIEKANLKKTISSNYAEIFFNQKQIRDLQKENNVLYKLKDEIKELKEQNNQLKTNNNNLNNKYKDLITKYNNLNSKYGNLVTEVNVLKEKVEFMEPIVLSLICRKVINYSIIKILQKYKRKIKVTLNNLKNKNKKNEIDNDNEYRITFIDSVNNVDIKTLNNLMDNLFVNKDEYNKDSHLINKELPSFIINLWDKVKENLKLNPTEIAAFDAIITNDIKSSFNFGAEDLSVKNYLKKVKIEEFGI